MLAWMLMENFPKLKLEPTGRMRCVCLQWRRTVLRGIGDKEGEASK